MRDGMYLLGITLMLCGCATPADNPMQMKNEEYAAIVTYDTKEIATYCYPPSRYKPYIKQLLTPDGLNVLADGPVDHVHHHGLMFACIVDGVNFWEEHGKVGTQLSNKVGSTSIITDAKEASVVLRGQVQWVDPGYSLLLEESRSIQISPANEADATTVTWQGIFSLPEGKAEATITGTDYHGLGMRLVRSMAINGTFIYAGDENGEGLHSEVQRLTSSKWCAYTAKIDDKPVTVAMFDDPKNPKPVTWFTMKNPFAYITATLRYHEQPVKITAGDKLTLRYGVALWDGEIEGGQVESTYQEWLKTLK